MSAITEHAQTDAAQTAIVLVNLPLCVRSRREVLQLTTSLDKLGPVSWRLALCLAIIWLICYFCVWKGVKSTGKVSRRRSGSVTLHSWQQRFATGSFIVIRCCRTGCDTRNAAVRNVKVSQQGQMDTNMKHICSRFSFKQLPLSSESSWMET